MTNARESLLKKLGEDKAANQFGRGFTTAYLAQAFGSLPKAEIDLLVFTLLMQTKVLTIETPLYEIARSLNITPAKARNLLFQHQLRTLEDAALDSTIAVQVTTARFGVDGKKLTFGIESPLVRVAIQARAKRRSVYLDVTLSGEILSVQLTDLRAFLETVLTPSQRDRVIERLKKAGFVDKDALGKFMDGLSKKITDAAVDKGGKKVGETLASHAFSFVAGAIGAGADIDFPMDLKEMM